MFLKILRTLAICFSKYKGLELYDFNDKKDLSYLLELKGLELYVFFNIKDLSYMFMRIERS